MIEVIDVIEKEDGSCEVQLELDEKSTKLLLEMGFNQLLKNAVEALEIED